MKIYDLGVLWEWEYDEKFVGLLYDRCQEANKSCFLVTSDNLKQTHDAVRSDELVFSVVLDRATDGNPAFFPIVRKNQQAGSRIINNPEKANKTHDRARMHLELISGGIHVPYSKILAPEDPIIEEDYIPIGFPLVAKTIMGEGGGDGVVLDVKNFDELDTARKQYPGETLLIQKHIHPHVYLNHRCWFRVFYVCGKVIPCFWDDKTHVYLRLNPDEETRFSYLKIVIERIYKVIGLDFFSSEIVWATDGKFQVVDYVNDQCDMRFKSDTPDGVPDEVVEEIIQAIVSIL